LKSEFTNLYAKLQLLRASKNAVIPSILNANDYDDFNRDFSARVGESLKIDNLSNKFNSNVDELNKLTELAIQVFSTEQPSELATVSNTDYLNVDRPEQNPPEEYKSPDVGGKRKTSKRIKTKSVRNKKHKRNTPFKSVNYVLLFFYNVNNNLIGW
jgi:hypothetical protein